MSLVDAAGWDALCGTPQRERKTSAEKQLAVYKAIGTVKECQEAMKKQIPKQNHHTRVDNINDEVRVSICPDCLGIIYTCKAEYPKYCVSCGQKIDWSDTERS